MRQFWSGSDLGEDVATISYESALRAHARYRPADRGEWAGDSCEQFAGGRCESADAGMRCARRKEQGAEGQRIAGAAHDGDLRTGERNHPIEQGGS